MYFANQPGYILSLHAQERAAERSISRDDMAQALAGRVVDLFTGERLHYSRRSHVALVADPATRVILTCYWLRRAEIKRLYSR